LKFPIRLSKIDSKVFQCEVCWVEIVAALVSVPKNVARIHREISIFRELMHWIGVENSDRIWSACLPKDPVEDSFEQIVEKLEKIVL
jgi:hypothetical protein